MESSRRAAQLGLGAAVLLLLACVTLIVAASVRADAGSSSSPLIMRAGTSVTR